MLCLSRSSSLLCSKHVYGFQHQAACFCVFQLLCLSNARFCGIQRQVTCFCDMAVHRFYAIRFSCRVNGINMFSLDISLVAASTEQMVVQGRERTAAELVLLMGAQ
jgi:hypothetical protein